ncbi:uncharacterized protein LOC117649413 [Thrips palmi]|uniref:Uncharacterized protein LOC117649413 n=1 Tax=Thrips palmi TaxID=161013 RepID=A0A6P8ZSN6_THRPL|nr:uncharacterized protein LOC117649413 [Thrips palmi]
MKVPFSVLMDGSTDHTAHKSMCVMVKYFSPRIKKSIIALLELVPLDARDCSAAKQYEALMKCFEDKGIPKRNIVGLGVDNENTMTGEHNSVWSRLRADVPHAMLMGCNCHSAASSAQVACGKMPPHLDELISRVTNYIGGSAKRQAGLEEFQEYFNAEKHKLLKLCTTRWLCRHQCVVRMLEQWDVLIHFFTAASFDEASLPQNRKRPATEIMNDLKNPFNRAYFLFIEYSLNFFNQFNALFQSKSVMIHKLRDKSIELLKDVCQNYLMPENVERILTTKIDDPRAYLPLDEVYMGPKCEKFMKELPQYKDGFKVVRQKCLDFYVAAAKDIASRLPPLNDMQFHEMKFVDPNVALSSASRREIRDLGLLVARFKDILQLDEEALAFEWRTMPNAIPEAEKKRLMEMQPDEAWADIGEMKTLSDELRFPQLSKLARCVLSLPHANSDCERVFAIVTDVRCKKRNRIGSACMNAISVSRCAFKAKGIDCTCFEVTKKHLELHNQEMYPHISKS